MYPSQSFSLFCAIPLFFFFSKTMFYLVFSDHSIHVAYFGFDMLLYFEHLVFLCWIMCSPTIIRTHEETKIKSSAREILSSVSSVISINIILVEQVLSTVKKPNQSPWQNAEIYRSYSHCHIQRFLLSLRHLFCWRIAKANWKILKLPWHFIAKALSTWILKADFIIPEHVQMLNWYLTNTYWYLTNMYLHN